MATERPKIEFEGADRNRKPKFTIKNTWILLRIGNIIVLGIILAIWAIYKAVSN
ncbi:MAG: hypothetical protein ABUK01_13035 [Leptospirales bacterium]